MLTDEQKAEGGLNVVLDLCGCDDTTTIKIEVSGEQLAFLRKLETLFEEASTYGCMPTLCVTPENPHD